MKTPHRQKKIDLLLLPDYTPSTNFLTDIFYLWCKSLVKNKKINYIHFESVPSTSTWAKENASILDPQKVTCITAQEQSAGRGQFSRKWFSPKGLNIYATLFFCLSKDFPFLQNIGQIASISTCKTLEVLGFSPQIKWPNDLLLDGKKVSGILSETIQLPDYIGIALGIGCNINMPKELTDQIDQKATSLMQISGKTWSLEEVLQAFLEQFLNDFSTLELEGFESFQSYYNSLLAFKDEPITIKDGSRSFQGICKGSTKTGKLILLLPSGKEVEIYSGEIPPGCGA